MYLVKHYMYSCVNLLGLRTLFKVRSQASQCGLYDEQKWYWNTVLYHALCQQLNRRSSYLQNFTGVRHFECLEHCAPK